MEQRPSGWYDDPHDETLLRYWDGITWTSHVAGKQPTPPAASTAGPVSEPGAGGSAQQWAQYQAQQAGVGSWGDPQDRRARSEAIRLSGWWRRVGALIVDTLLVGLLCAPVTFNLVSMDLIDQWVTQMTAAASSGGAAPTPPDELMTQLITVGLVQTIVYILAEAAFLSRRGVTPGRRLTGIRVRPVGSDTPLPFAMALRRGILKNVANLFGGAPVLSLLATGFQVVDYLWPLADRGHQSLHDKVARTEVVRSGPLPRRKA